MFPICNSLMKLFISRSLIQFSTKVRPARRKRRFGSDGKDDLRMRINADNPGVDNQIELLQPDSEELQDPEYFEDADPSFWDVGSVHKEHEREKSRRQYLKGVHQVNRKYFKEDRSPSMLMWEEMEHIRSLHEQDPETWTVPKLAISFPASPTIIQKIIKAKWRPRTPEDVARHDRKVQQNWDKLRAGKLDVPDHNLKEHLLLFSHRRQMSNSSLASSALSVCSKTDSEVKSGMFTSILKSYEKSQEVNQTPTGILSPIEEDLDKLRYPPKLDTFAIPQSKNYKSGESTTLDIMRQRVFEKKLKGKMLNEMDEEFVCNVDQGQQLGRVVLDPVGCPPQSNTSSSRKVSDSNIQEARTEVEDDDFTDMTAMQDGGITTKHKQTERSIQKRNSSSEVGSIKSYGDSPIDVYPLKIEIPKEKWRKGLTYQFKDCFYGDDGEFLYRVPGFKNDIE